MKREGQRDGKRRREGERERERERKRKREILYHSQLQYLHPNLHAYLAHLKCGSHLAVDLILLLGDLDVALL